MHAIVLSAYGPPSHLEWKEVPSTPPGAKEVLVKLAASSVNPFDAALRSGKLTFIPLALPAVLGRDVAGIVLAVGDGVEGIRVGDHVMALAGKAYAEEVVVPAETVARVPDGLSIVDAGALPLVLTTGAQLADALPLPAGSTVLVTGALGMVGRATVYAARKRGLRVVVGVRRSSMDAAASLGADGVVAIDDERAIAELPRFAGVLDTAGPAVLSSLIPRLGEAQVASVVGNPPPVGQKVVGRPDAGRLADLARAVATGELKIPIVERFPLAQAAEAHARFERGVAGKVLLVA